MNQEVMIINNTNYNIHTRPLHKAEEIPYRLLLLADETVDDINKYIFDSEIYVLELEGQIIALYALQVIDEDTIEIKNIAVDEAFQGQGIGQFLLNDAFEIAKQKKFKTMLICTGDAGIKQLYIYQKVGFEMFDIKRGFFLDNYPEPIYENGIQLKHMVMLKKTLT